MAPGMRSDDGLDEPEREALRDGDDAFAVEAPRASGGSSASARHALIRGLRLPRSETQLTRVIAEIAASDRRFAGAFVALILRVVASDKRHAAAGERMGRVPDELDCVTERHVYDENDVSAGRVDLRFDDGTDFTLIVENKLYAEFGPEQLPRYHRALKALPPGGRRGLVAITRDVPSRGELDINSEHWLGTVRWARLLQEENGLAELPIADPDVKVQWKLLLDVLGDQGDLGLTTVDTDLIVAWARHREGEEHLAGVLSDLREGTLDSLRRALHGTYPAWAGRDAVAGQRYFGRQPVKLRREDVSTAFHVPADSERSTISVMFWFEENGQPLFSVQVMPTDSAERFEGSDDQLQQAARRLGAAGFRHAYEENDVVWWSEHRVAEYGPGHGDIVTRLAELAEADITAIVQSGILDGDLAA